MDGFRGKIMLHFARKGYIRNNQILIIVFAILGIVFIVGLATLHDILPLSLLALAILPLDIILKNQFKLNMNTRMIFYLILFFIIEEFMGARGLNLPLPKIEMILLISLNIFSLVRNKIRICFSKKLLWLWFVIIAFILNDFISIMSLYNSIEILKISLFAFCKYFLLVFFIINEQISEEQVRNLLKAFFIVLATGSLITVLQALDVSPAYWFQGTYDIVIRSETSRTIGYFAYPISFASHNVILFCLYFFTNKYSEKKSKIFSIAIALTIFNAILTQTRVALLALIIIVVIDNIKHFKSMLKYIFLVLIIALIVNQFISLGDMWQVTISEYLNINGSPRQYFIQNGLAIFRDNPMFGIGYNTYANNEVRLLSGDFIFQQYGLYLWDFAGLLTTDTFYAGLLPEFGIFGLALVFLFGRDMFKKYKKVSKISPTTKTYILMILAGLILGANCSSALYSPSVGGLIWIGIGLLYSNYMKYEATKDSYGKLM